MRIPMLRIHFWKYIPILDDKTSYVKYISLLGDPILGDVNCRQEAFNLEDHCITSSLYIYCRFPSSYKMILAKPLGTNK